MIKKILPLNVKTSLFNSAKSLIRAKEYTPLSLLEIPPKNYLDIESAWRGLEKIIPDIVNQFEIKTNKCLEFGVDYGYSSAVFSNYFNQVIGVDLFLGDKHAGYRELFIETKERLAKFPNIEVHKADYKDWIIKDKNSYDLIHVDIIHTYEDTYKCGLWAAEHSKCAIFHDTESFLGVRKAVRDIAKKTGKTFYNYPHHFGLGIIV